MAKGQKSCFDVVALCFIVTYLHVRKRVCVFPEYRLCQGDIYFSYVLRKTVFYTVKGLTWLFIFLCRQVNLHIVF